MNENSRFSLSNIDGYSLVMDILHNLWAAVLGALALSLALYMFNSTRHVDRYTCSATFAVMSKKIQQLYLSEFKCCGEYGTDIYWCTAE